jgi:hypothetical protein
MCIFHKWSNWVQYSIDSYRIIDSKKQIVMSEKKQKRVCKKCNKEQNELITIS